MRRCVAAEKTWERRPGRRGLCRLALTARYNACTDSKLEIDSFFLIELTNSM